MAKVTASASLRCGYQSWGVSLPLKLVVVRTTSWREGVLLGRPDRSRIYARIDALPFKKNKKSKISCMYLATKFSTTAVEYIHEYILNLVPTAVYVGTCTTTKFACCASGCAHSSTT